MAMPTCLCIVCGCRTDQFTIWPWEKVCLTPDLDEGEGVPPLGEKGRHLVQERREPLIGLSDTSIELLKTPTANGVKSTIPSNCDNNGHSMEGETD